MYPTENYKIMMKESIWVETLRCREFAKIGWKITVPLPNIPRTGFKWSMHVHISAGLGIWIPVISCGRPGL